jgi:hypothetical protein
MHLSISGPRRFGAWGPFPLEASRLTLSKKQPVCPHCNESLQPFSLPDNTGWQSEFQLACFNDECPYFQRGWKHMDEHYAVKTSYRYRIDPVSGRPSPLAVWSKDAIKDRILDATVTAEADRDTTDTPDEGSAP